ncbi:hypothetical protein J3R30DRAFT_3695732 [Lentinula aciculospora]|uniref:F-box domain-containing protein n=1 Tax=Lentinula aciculospora TaxID=153920 RepID=A0A9W9ARP6_9AGAR|nr:hypothetical protein J3R30DRAFT_3695732 [Lentinula aciculospora]
MSRSRLSELPLPQDILREIASCIDPINGIELLNFALTSKSFYTCISPFLFHDIEVRDLDRAMALVQYLLARPGRACLVHSLILRPSYIQTTSKKRLAGERELALLLKRLAPNLLRLRKLVWDGLEVPESAVWAALRAGCPLLKEIGTNLGCEKLDLDSQLFAFSDLESFSLTTEIHGGRCYQVNIDFIRGGDKLPQALWTMLIDRCPRLRSLVLGDRGATLCCDRKLDLRPIGLKHLSYYKFSPATFGGNGADDGDENDNGDNHEHSNTETPHGHQPRRDSRLALLSHDRGLPRSQAIKFSVLQELTLTDGSYHSIVLPMFKVVAQLLPSLKKLGVWIDFSHIPGLDLEGSSKRSTRYDQLKELRELYECCPIKLESLKLLLSTKSKETMFWRDIPLILRRKNQISNVSLGRCQLKSLEVWKVNRRGDHGVLGNAALKIALDEEFDYAVGHHIEHSSTPINLTAPLLENIVLVVFLDQWSNNFTKRVRIIQHTSYKVRRRFIGRDHLANNSASNSIPPSAVSSTKSRESNTFILPPLLKPVQRLKHWAQTRNTSVAPEMVISLKANERGPHVTWILSNRYDIHVVPLPSHGKMMLDGKRVRFELTQVVVGDNSKESKEAGTGRKWRAISSGS